MAELRYVKGLEGLLATLKALPPAIVSKSGGPVRSALRKGGVVFQKAAKENVKAIVAEQNQDGRPSISTGLLEKSIIVSRKKPSPGTKGERFQVRVKRGAKSIKGVSANKYGGILEFGYYNMPAKAWMRRAFESNKGQALDVIVSTLRKRTEAAARKARKLGLVK